MQIGVLWVVKQHLDSIEMKRAFHSIQNNQYSFLFGRWFLFQQNHIIAKRTFVFILVKTFHTKRLVC